MQNVTLYMEGFCVLIFCVQTAENFASHRNNITDGMKQKREITLP